MVEKWLTDEEKQAFKQEMTRGLALDYFFHFDNAPLHFVYRDGVIHGELTELERRNKTITETTWLDAYNYGCIATIHNTRLFRKGCLQVPFQSSRQGAVQPGPISEESSEGRVYRTADEVQADLDAWMAAEGWQLMDDRRRNQTPTMNDWGILLGAPDRTMRLGSFMAYGNQVIVEAVLTWSEDGVLKETVFPDIMHYDIDGIILNERAYVDTVNWPASPGTRARSSGSQGDRSGEGQLKGGFEVFFNRYADRKIEPDLTDLEKRNKGIIEGPWVEAYNTGLDRSIFHPDRYRVQLPLQKVSYSGEKSAAIEAAIRQAVPDRRLQVVLDYAKGNQVVAECIISWTENGVYKETPFISFLMLDEDGLIIRDRTYLFMAHWPGANQMPESFTG